MKTRAGYLVCWVLAIAPWGAGAELPKRKPGLWEINLQFEGKGFGAKSTQCIDEKTDAEMIQRSMQGDGATKCTQTQFTKTGSGYETDYSCTTEQGGKMTGHVVVSGDFNTAFVMQQHAHFDPPQSGRADMRQTANYRYLGACPAGMQPGDMNIGGVKFDRGFMTDAAKSGKGKFNPEDIKKLMEQMKQRGHP